MSDQKTLHLNLIRKWFDMIESGEKKEEYREIYKPDGSLNWWFIRRVAIEYHPVHQYDDGEDFQQKDKNGKWRYFTWKPFTYQRFDNGMSKACPRLICYFGGISIGTGNPEWGAVPGKEYFCIHISNPRRTR